MRQPVGAVFGGVRTARDAVIHATAQEDVFVLDRVPTTRERASLAADGSQLDGHSPV